MKAQRTVVRDLTPLAASYGLKLQLHDTRPSAKNGDQALADRIQKMEQAFCTLVDRLGENPGQLDCAALIDHLAEGE